RRRGLGHGRLQRLAGPGPEIHDEPGGTAHHGRAAAGSKRAAAERGELRAPLPVGLVYDADGMVVLDPDAEVQAAVADIFACFAAAGSAYGVVAAFAGRKFPQRAYGGVWAGQLRWAPLTHHRVLQVPKNPAYAGAYGH